MVAVGFADCTLRHHEAETETAGVVFQPQWFRHRHAMFANELDDVKFPGDVAAVELEQVDALVGADHDGLLAVQLVFGIDQDGFFREAASERDEGSDAQIFPLREFLLQIGQYRGLVDWFCVLLRRCGGIGIGTVETMQVETAFPIRHADQPRLFCRRIVFIQRRNHAEQIAVELVDLDVQDRRTHLVGEIIADRDCVG